jgi:hypothetical protein
MIFLAKRQTLHIWIALLAILFSALAPTVSHAVAAYAPEDALAMCTVNGYKQLDDSKAPGSIKHGMEHCAFCTIHGGGDALPAVPSVALAIAAGRDVYPPLFYAAPRSQHAWSASNPRAPPFFA